MFTLTTTSEIHRHASCNAAVTIAHLLRGTAAVPDEQPWLLLLGTAPCSQSPPSQHSRHHLFHRCCTSATSHPLSFPRSQRSAAAVTVQRCCSHPMPAPSSSSSPPSVSVEITVASAPLPVSTHAAALARSEPRRHCHPSSLLIIQRCRCCPVDAAPPLCLLFRRC